MKMILLGLLLILVPMALIIALWPRESGWDQLKKAKEDGLKDYVITKPLKFKKGQQIILNDGETLTIHSPDIIKP